MQQHRQLLLAQAAASRARNRYRPGPGSLAALLILVALLPSAAMAKTYNYVVEVPADDPFTKKTSFTINDRKRTCSGTTCTWKSSDSSPSQEGCRKMRARINKQILAYGHEGRMLSAAQLRGCNGQAGSYRYSATFYGDVQDRSIKYGKYMLKCSASRKSCSWTSYDASPSIDGCRKLQKHLRKRVKSYGSNSGSLSQDQIARCNQTGKHKYIAKYNIPADEPGFNKSRESVRDGILRTCLNRGECFWYSDDITPSVAGCRAARKYPTNGGETDVAWYGVEHTQVYLRSDDLKLCNADQSKGTVDFQDSKAYVRCRDAITGYKKPIKDVSISGHTFHCYAARKTGGSRDQAYIGKLSHALRFRPDDQFKYRINVKNKYEEDCIVSVDVYIEKGGVAPVPGTVARWVGKGGFEDAWREAAKDWDGTEWEAIGHSLVGEAAQYFGCK